ncbi:MAG: ASCH domain-containing protein [Oscillospiraceae bacterium]|nr:ASCH domain-containing protein [Oscillospiraceae bacterium]
MKPEELWERFALENDLKDASYTAWAFGSAPDELAALVLSGEKTATCSALEMYELENEPLPEARSYSLVLDSKGEARCIIKTVRVRVLPFNEVGEEHAFKEGEGDKSLSFWRRVHEEVFTQELEEAGLSFSETAPLVCEEFEVVYK